MRIGVQAKLILVSVGVMALVGTASAIFLERQVRGWLSASPSDDLTSAVLDLRWMIFGAGVFGLFLAVFMSGLAVRFIVRTVREQTAHPGPLPPAAGAREEIERVVGTLAAERALFRTLLEGLDEAVLALDDSGRVVSMNRAARDLLGVEDSALGQPLARVTRDPGILDLVAAVQESGEAASAELAIRRPTERQILVRAASLETGGHVVVIRDLTTLRRLERVRRDFVANVSHELRTPVSVIRANAETLLDGPAQDWPAPERRFMEAIGRNANRLTDLIGDLMDIARVEAGTFRLALSPVSISGALAQASETLSGAAAARGTQVVIDSSADLHVSADPRALDQVLLNLIENGIKYGREAGTLELRATKTPRGRVRVDIEDDGPGIEPRHRVRIFERFYRVDAGRTKQAGGTGLGLAIVKHLVLSMGGEVGVEDGANGGTCFWFELPEVTAPSGE